MTELKPIRWRKNRLLILDQALLPQQVKYLECRDFRQVACAVREMRVRGAPLIGITAAFGLALCAVNSGAKTSENLYKELEAAARLLTNTRPTAVNLSWAVNRILKVASDGLKDLSPVRLRQVIVNSAKQLYREDESTNKKLSRIGAKLIPNQANILTHCNAGGLATSGYGTALGVIKAAKEDGKAVKVYVDETRPKLQGARLTTWELMQAKIPCVLICDNMAGDLMKKQKIDLVIVGADRIAANGDVANKIGTYSLAVLANAHNIPFYVAAPISTFDFSIEDGNQIPIEARSELEVTNIENIRIAPKNIEVYNPAFDVTPNHLITAIITEAGILEPPFKSSIRAISSKIE